MANKYIIKYTDNNCIEISKPNSSILIYKIPYNEIKKEIIDIDITNRFIVYILIGKDKEKNNIVYVGKSKNGIDQRPTAHETEGEMWEYCFILTTFNEKTFFNDGIIQHIENILHKRFLQNNIFSITTKVTNFNTIGYSDIEDCEDYIFEAYKMLYVLGLDLLPKDDMKDDTVIKKENGELTDLCSDILSKL